MQLFFSLHWIACIIRKTNAEQKLKDLKINIYIYLTYSYITTINSQGRVEVFQKRKMKKELL